jgi:hypothetical protein
MTGSEWSERTRQQKQPTILIAVALAHDQSLSPEAHHNGSLSFKYPPTLTGYGLGCGGAAPVLEPARVLAITMSI